MSFLKIWLVFAGCGAVVFSAVFVWAVRSRQFSDMDRARYIALQDGQTERRDASEPVSCLDRCMPLFLVLLAAAVVASTVWMGIANR